MAVASLHLNSPKRNGPRSGDLLLAPRLCPRLCRRLEVKLQCKLHYATATLGLNLTEVVLCLLGKVEPTSRIANIGSVATVPARPADQGSGANRVQRQVDVTVIRVC